MMQPTKRKTFVNRDTVDLLPFAVMAPATGSGVELDGDDGVLRLGRPTSVHASAQDAGVCFVNDRVRVAPESAGSCSQGEIVQALIRQDDSDGIDNKALIVPGAAVGPAIGSQGLTAGGSAFRFLGFEGCTLEAPSDKQNPKHKFRVGWVTPSYSAAVRFFQAEERRMQQLEPYFGAGLIQDAGRASLAGGDTRPILSSTADFSYRRYRQTAYGTPELPAAEEGDGSATAEPGAVAIRCERDGVFLMGFTASVRTFSGISNIDPLHLALLVERKSFDYPSHATEELRDAETRLFRTDWQQGVYARAEGSISVDEVVPVWHSLGGQTIVSVKAGDIFHVVNVSHNYAVVRYLNVWATSLQANGLAFG